MSAHLYLKGTHTDKIQASGSSWSKFFWPLAAWNFFLCLSVISICYENPSTSEMILHSGTDRQETNCFCVNKGTVMNSHTNSNCWTKIAIVAQGIRELEFQLCLWPMGTNHNFFQITVSMPSVKQQLWSRNVSSSMWPFVEKSFMQCRYLIDSEDPSLSKHQSSFWLPVVKEDNLSK